MEQKKQMKDDFVNRMICEYRELSERARKLRVKVSDTKFMRSLEVIKGNLLIAQYQAMETYRCILWQRLLLENVDPKLIADDEE